MKWQNKLTKSELIHLKFDAKVNTLRDLKECRSAQKEFAATVNSPELCFDCKIIAQKLGIE